MARLIWTEPALIDLDIIAEYIALDNPDAARKLGAEVFASAERLKRFPKSGSYPPEIKHLPYRKIVVSPCCIFYRLSEHGIFIVFVMRGEQELRVEELESRDQ